MNKFIFDIQITGHYSKCISKLIDYFALNIVDNGLVFILHSEFLYTFNTIANRVKSIKRVACIETSSSERVILSKSKNLIKYPFCFFNLMNSYAKRFNFKHVYILCFNSFHLSLIFHKKYYKLRSILFFEFYTMQKAILKNCLKYYSKYSLKNLYVNITSFKSYVEKSFNFLNKTFKTKSFEVISNQISKIVAESESNVRECFLTPRESKMFSHIGLLDVRNSILEILNNFNFLNEPLRIVHENNARNFQ